MGTHLSDVAEAAARFAEHFAAADEARAAGLLHDLGKYAEIFQQRLKGTVDRVDHSSAGAWAALTEIKENGVAIALCIQGHHAGLQVASRDALEALQPGHLRETRPNGFALPAESIDELLIRFHEDGLELPRLVGSIYRWPRLPANTVADMLDVRMLFSALVDADFLETEAHFQARTATEKTRRPTGPPLNPGRALKELEAYLAALSSQTIASPAVTQLRADLLKACLEAGHQAKGLFTLSAPTGAGKTLAMLAFALKHAHEHGLRRIVVVIPYLSIIEQTVAAYRQALERLGDADHLREYVLESHSLAGTRQAKDASGADVASSDQERLLAENWDAPIVVTTSVQFLESLFAHGPRACRKLHRLADSVVLFDEVQTLPVRLVVPTLSTLAHLSERYGTSVVFATATQPAFDHLNESVSRSSGVGWRPREIVPPNLELFTRARRTAVRWPASDERLPWERLAERLKGERQVLCVVNLKRHALGLLDRLSGAEGLFHLSTNMCPAHRMSVLDAVRGRLKNGEPCRLVSTQCVEAGVDLDFPVVFRAWGPLDAIAQAAGRCNREGKSQAGDVYVFFPDDSGSLYPDPSYAQAASVAKTLLQQRGSKGMDIQDEDLFRQYYTRLYSIADPEVLSQDLLSAATRQDFVNVDSLYRVIHTDAVNVLVPYDLEAYRELSREGRQQGLTASWIARARPHAVSIFRPRHDAAVGKWLQAVPVGPNMEPSRDWFIYLGESHYDPHRGLSPPNTMECLIA